MSRAARNLPQDFGDPFGATADPACYVAREATERALEELERAIIDSQVPALLVGLPGIGKTLLLRLLRRRLEPHLEPIHLPYAALPPAALCNWALNAISAPPSWDPVGALATRAHHAFLEGRGGFVLLIDDAEVMSEETARVLATLVRDAQGGLRFVAAVDRDAADRVAGWVGEAAWVPLVDPMTPAETLQYVQTRLHRTALPPHAIDAFDAETMAALHERSGGIPGRIGAEASAVLLRALRPARADREPELEPELEIDLETSEAMLGRIDLQTIVAPAPTESESTPEPEVEVEPEVEPPPVAAPESEPPATEPVEEIPVEAMADVAPALEFDPIPEETLDLGEEISLEDAAPLEEAPAPAPPPPPPPAPEPEAPVSPEIALERAAGRLALAHSGADAGTDSAAFERAVGRLALAQETAEQPSPEPQPEQPKRPTPKPRAPEPERPRPVEPAARTSRGRWLAVAIVIASVAMGVLLAPRIAERFESVELAGPPAEPESVEPAPLPTPPPVRVQINATPWARVRVDGQELGVTPLAGVQLAPGPHHFEAQFADGTVVERVVEIDPVNRFVAFP